MPIKNNSKNIFLHWLHFFSVAIKEVLIIYKTKDLLECQSYILENGIPPPTYIVYWWLDALKSVPAFWPFPKLPFPPQNNHFQAFRKWYQCTTPSRGTSKMVNELEPIRSYINHIPTWYARFSHFPMEILNQAWKNKETVFLTSYRPNPNGKSG